jgi:hypothetical protein
MRIFVERTAICVIAPQARARGSGVRIGAQPPPAPYLCRPLAALRLETRGSHENRYHGKTTVSL